MELTLGVDVPLIGLVDSSDDPRRDARKDKTPDIAPLIRALTIDIARRLRLDNRGSGEIVMRKLGIVALCATLGGCVSAGETLSFRPSNPQQQAMMRDGAAGSCVAQKVRWYWCGRRRGSFRPAAGRSSWSASTTSQDSRSTSRPAGRGDPARRRYRLFDAGRHVSNARPGRAQPAGGDGHHGRRSLCGEFTPRFARRSWHLHHAGRTERQLLHSDRRGDRTGQRRRAERSHLRRHRRSGQRNMAALEQAVIKDNTLMPGESYGGTGRRPPTDQAGGQNSIRSSSRSGRTATWSSISQVPSGS